MLPSEARTRPFLRAASCPRPPGSGRPPARLYVPPGDGGAAVDLQARPSAAPFATRILQRTNSSRRLQSRPPLIWPPPGERRLMIIGLMGDKGGVCQDHRRPEHGSELPSSTPPVLLVDADKQADLTELCGCRRSQHRHGCHPPPGSDTVGAGLHRSVAPGIDLIGTHPR